MPEGYEASGISQGLGDSRLHYAFGYSHVRLVCLVLVGFLEPTNDQDQCSIDQPNSAYGPGRTSPIPQG